MTGKIVIHMRGLPWEADNASIGEFLEITPDDVEEIRISKAENGKPSGEGYVVIKTEAIAEKAMQKHKQTMAGTNRYIELFRSSEQAMNAGGGMGGKGQWDGVVKLTNVPMTATVDQISNIFEGLEWMDNGITLPMGMNNQCIGEAFVQFLDYTNANASLTRNAEINGQFLTISKSNNAELRQGLIKGLKVQYGLPPVVPNLAGGDAGNGFGNFANSSGTWGGLNIGGSRNMAQRGRPAPY